MPELRRLLLSAAAVAALAACSTLPADPVSPAHVEWHDGQPVLVDATGTVTPIGDSIAWGKGPDFY